MEQNTLLLAAGWNLFVLLVYGLDKWKAKHNQWRVSEKALLTMSLLGGGVGAACGMLLFHHKTSNLRFRITVPIGLLASIGEFLVLWQG